MIRRPAMLSLIALLPLAILSLAAAFGQAEAHSPSASTARPRLPRCDSHHRRCVPYRGGTVMSTTRTYAIFWLPPRDHLERHGSDATYERLMVQFLRDIGGTPYYSLLTQYSHSPRGKLVTNGPIRNVSTFSGSYLDRSPYPKAGTSLDPLVNVDFLQEIQAITAKTKWPIDTTSLFFVFTAAGIRSCNSVPCKYSPDFCAAHFGYPDGPFFAVIEPPYRDGCQSLFHHTPNRDPVADRAIDLTSHELFETVTDPWPCRAWITRCGYDTTGLEIGDLCQDQYGRRNRDGSNLVLHDHTYLVQKEWSNGDARCVLFSSPFPPPPSPSSSSGFPVEIVVGGMLAALLTVLVAALALVQRRRMAR